MTSGENAVAAIGRRLARIDWGRIEREMDADGFSRLPGLLNAVECRRLVTLYRRDALFRSTVSMERHAFGRGSYRYFAYPLPPLVQGLREGAYARLSPIANRWAVRLGGSAAYPHELREYLGICHRAGQTRPTPLLLCYEESGYNRLHQDLYGAQAFPMQIVIPLSAAGRDYEGGELVLVEQRPRAQSRATVLRPGRGDGVLFTNRERPVRGVRGDYRVQMRHGASTVTRGRRLALGIIFHDAA